GPRTEPGPEPGRRGVAPPEEGQRDDGRRRRRRRRGGRNGEERVREGTPPEQRPVAEHESAEAPRFEESANSGNGSLMPADELAAAGRGLAENLFRAMGFEAQITAPADADSVEVRAEIGQDSDLITRHKPPLPHSIHH